MHMLMWARSMAISWQWAGGQLASQCGQRLDRSRADPGLSRGHIEILSSNVVEEVTENGAVRSVVAVADDSIVDAHLKVRITWSGVVHEVLESVERVSSALEHAEPLEELQRCAKHGWFYGSRRNGCLEEDEHEINRSRNFTSSQRTRGPH